MTSFLLPLILVFTLICRAAWGISFGPLDFYSPAQWKMYTQSNPQHPLSVRARMVERAWQATLFVPKRGTAVIVSPDGIVLTAAHVIAHAYIGPVASCPKLFFIMHHRRDDQDQKVTERRLECEAVLAYDYGRDTARIKVKLPADLPSLPFMPVAQTPAPEDSMAFIIGHPGAANYDQSYAKLTFGKVVVDQSGHSEVPHLLHLIDTEGGNSGSPIFNLDGEVVAIHSRGIERFSEGVEGTLDGVRQRFHRFNLGMMAPQE